jgi:5,10-methylenetetrahydromethanopterin reductase
VLPRLALRCHGGLAPAACVAQAVAAERAGFSTLWLAENPFQRGAWPALSAAAVATRRIRLGAGVFNPFTRHPTLMAMEMAAFDELCEGRAILGIGSGIATRLGRLGLVPDRRIAAVRDTLAIVRGLLRGEEVRHSGKVFSAEGVRLEFTPRRPDLPILLAAMGPQAQRLCGESSDGLLLSNLCPPAYTRRAVAAARAAAVRAGRAAPQEVVQYVPCAVRADGAEARRLARETVAAMLTAYWSQQNAAPATRAAIADGSDLAPGEFAHLMARLERGEPAASVIDDRLLAEYAIAGTVDECLERCALYAEAGVTELAVWFLGDRAVEDIARLGGREPTASGS